MPQKYRPFTDEEKKQMHSKYRKNGRLNRDYRRELKEKQNDCTTTSN